MVENNPQEVLQKEILTDGQRRAEQIVKAAEEEAEKFLSARRKAVDAEVESILAEGRRRAQRRAELILRTVDQEVGRRKLLAREDLIQQAVDQARAQLEDLSGRDYRETVVRLAAAAVRGMCAARFVIQIVSSADGAADFAGLAEEVQTLLARDGRKVAVRVEMVPGPSKGVIVFSEDKRLRWDNTFDARLRRLRSDLRRRIAPVLLEET